MLNEQLGQPSFQSGVINDKLALAVEQVGESLLAAG
jgi:hypothetical protein